MALFRALQAEESWMQRFIHQLSRTAKGHVKIGRKKPLSESCHLIAVYIHCIASIMSRDCFYHRLQLPCRCYQLFINLVLCQFYRLCLPAVEKADHIDMYFMLSPNIH